MRLVYGRIRVVKVIHLRDTGTKVSSRLLVAVEKRDGGSEVGLARLTWQAGGRLRTCRDTCVRDLGLKLVCGDSSVDVSESCSFQIRSSRHLYPIIFLRIFHSARLLETPCYRLVPWMPSLHPHNTTTPPVFTLYSRTPHRTPRKSGDISRC